MRAVDTIQAELCQNLYPVSLSRQKTLFYAVRALLRGGKLSVTGLGRAAKGKTTPKHNIKRIDRLLGNSRLHDEIKVFCRSMNTKLLRPNSRPLILVDWTKLKSHCALFAAVSHKGRSMTLYYELHPLSKLSNRAVQIDFLKTLKSLMPEGVVPTIVTDAGFMNPWFQAVEELGWSFVGRLNPRVLIQPRRGKLTRISKLEVGSRRKPKDWGICSVTIRNPRSYRVIQGKKFKRDPKRKKSRRLFTHKGRGGVQSAKRNQLSWVLGTNRTDLSAQQVIDVYEHRMRIEELFRDFKNSRFGWSLGESLTRDANRSTVLVLIGLIGYFIVTLLGVIAEKKGLHLQFQTNSLKSRRVLSLFFLGKEIIRLGLKLDYAKSDLNYVLQEIRDEVAAM